MIRPVLVEVFAEGGAEPYAPPDLTCFCVLCDAWITDDQGGEGADSFKFWVCNAEWLRRGNEEPLPLPLKGYFLVDEWDQQGVKKTIAALCAEISAPDWRTLAERLNRVLNWEYEYQADDATDSGEPFPRPA